LKFNLLAKTERNRIEFKTVYNIRQSSLF